MPTPAATPEVLRLEARGIAISLAAVAAALVLASVVSAITGVGKELFRLDGERNLPTYFAAFLLLFAASLLAVVAIVKRRWSDRYARHWAGLAVTFLLISIDELVGVHEMTSPALRAFGGTRSTFPDASALLLSALVLLFTLLFFRFAIHLPRTTRALFLCAAALYVTGALGAEMVEGLVVQWQGAESALYTMVTTIEESLEMGGVILFIHALLGYLATDLGGPRLQLSARGVA